jgi:Xaa-Pro dipeptidase
MEEANLVLNRKELIFKEIKNQNTLIVLMPGKNLYYLTGIDVMLSLERPFLYLVNVGENYTYLIASKLYEKELDCRTFSKYYFYTDLENPFSTLEKYIVGMGLVNKEIDMCVEKTLPCYIYNNLNSILKTKNILYVDNIISKSRIIKNSDEETNILKAAFIVDETFKKLCKETLKGKSEKDIAALIDYIMRSLGARGSSFETIVAVSENAADPHHIPNDRVVKKGDSIVFDFGAIYNGYCSDITRTVFVGEPNEEAQKIYDIVKEAQNNAINAVAKGSPIKNVDIAARSTIEKYGYGQYFIHRTGHGIGLDIHEEPYVTAENNNILVNGMVFTIEPGIYINKKIGIRIEDDILVKGKANILTKSTKELIIFN